MSPATLAEPPPAAPPRPRASLLPDLILARLLVAPKGVAASKLRTDLAVFFRRPLAAESVNAAVAELRGDGFLLPGRGQRATDAGRARALEFLGVETLPPRANWGTVKAKYLTPMALGLPVGSEHTADTVGKAEKFAAFLLKQRLGLPVGTGSTLNAVFEAIACRELGYPDHTELRGLREVILSKRIGSDEQLDTKGLAKVAPRILLGTTKGVQGLRAAALAGWADGETEGEQPGPVMEEPFDLEMFANTVASAARTCPTGWFGGNKVFISHVWNQLKNDRPFAALGREGFKQKLVDANREGRLTLSRADLVQLMDPADVAASETTYLTATFHFILVERD